MQWKVPLAFGPLGVDVGLFADGRGHGDALEAVPYHVDSQRRRMRHIGTIVAVVPQLVKDDLIGGKVGN